LPAIPQASFVSHPSGIFRQAFIRLSLSGFPCTYGAPCTSNSSSNVRGFNTEWVITTWLCCSATICGFSGPGLPGNREVIFWRKIGSISKSKMSQSHKREVRCVVVGHSSAFFCQPSVSFLLPAIRQPCPGGKPDEQHCIQSTVNVQHCLSVNLLILIMSKERV
jgi:hypothetical protein